MSRICALNTEGMWCRKALSGLFRVFWMDEGKVGDTGRRMSPSPSVEAEAVESKQ